MMALLVGASLSFQVGTLERVEFEFVPCLDIVVGIETSAGLVVGTLNIHGDFKPLPNMQSYLSSTNIYTLLNAATTLDRRFVYELRAGMLVPGSIRVGEAFVPDPKGQVEWLEDYRPLHAKGPIYNLPGYFRPVQRAEVAPQGPRP